MRIGQERPELRKVLERDRYRCVACGFDLRCALAAHHRVPRELGGRDIVENLTTLCANCHRAVHWLSVAGRLNGQDGEKVRRLYTSPAFSKLAELAEEIQQQRARIKQAGRRWLKQPDSDGPVSLAGALASVAARNHFDAARTAALEKVVARVLDHLPKAVLEGCAVRVVQRGRHFSINAGNILLFRAPGVFDGVRDPDGDVLLIWPEDSRLSVMSDDEWREVREGEGTFAAIPCFDLPLSFEQVLKMSTSDWRTFTKSCRDAVRLGPKRHWISNVNLNGGLDAIS